MYKRCKAKSAKRVQGKGKAKQLVVPNLFQPLPALKFIAPNRPPKSPNQT